MARRIALRGLTALGVLIMAGALATTVFGQAISLRVVQGSDGTLYLVQAGHGWTLVPDQISDSDLAALTPSGEIDGTIPVQPLGAAQPAATQAPAAAPQPAPTEAVVVPTPIPTVAPTPVPAAPAPTVAPTAAPKPAFSSDPTVAIQAPFSGENVGVSNGNFTIKGYAVDRNAGPSQGTGVDHVYVYLNAPQNSGGISLGDAQLGASNSTTSSYGTQFSSGGWTLTFSPTKYSDGGTNVYAYAHSAVTGKTSMQSLSFNIVEGSGN